MSLGEACQEFILLPPPFPEFQDDYSTSVRMLDWLFAVAPDRGPSSEHMVVDVDGQRRIKFRYNIFKRKVGTSKVFLFTLRLIFVS